MAHQSYVPGLVGLERIVEGNAKLQATASVAQVAGPALGGLLLRVLAAPLLIAVTVLTYLMSAAAVGRIRATEDLPPAADRRPLRTEIAEGLDEVPAGTARADERLGPVPRVGHDAAGWAARRMARRPPWGCCRRCGSPSHSRPSRRCRWSSHRC